MLEVFEKNKIIFLSLNHPEKGNSLGLEESLVLTQCLKRKDLQGLVLTAKGPRFFCTGGNLLEQKKWGKIKSGSIPFLN
jgi:enoyl-CoA hydratase/carnithine racemase